MKMRMRILAAAAALTMTVTAAWALTVTQAVSFPRVNSSGALDAALGANVNVKANINTTNGGFRASGHGQVQNQSGKTQTFINSPVTIPSVTVTGSRYVVKKNGKCTVTASGFAIL